ncbi:MAG: thymidine kinase [Candidatus Eisenbacteria bacterium]|uniref:Thymidine kinase n=1 Tax=Eiseniibacteriota bacterium TaxID=2212470 RepID=A0A956NHA0_UNCEI|nr:thymidine kinase [Candidatus Eisenbacteria bacterium]MCB9462499.1 thymidine kinase [Candidatus Eisenbacteria bacterium]
MLDEARRGEPPRMGGVVEVICGPMFSGKTEELIRRLRRAQIARQKVVVLKPFLDDRYADDHIVSHNSQRVPSVRVESSEDVRLLGMNADVVGIDEVQFLDAGIVEVVEELADSGRRVIVAGLDLDYRGIPFEPMPQLLARAEYITKALAICVVCGHPASRSQRVTGEGERIVVGSTDHYEARCRSCFRAPIEEETHAKDANVVAEEMAGIAEGGRRQQDA